MIDPTQVASVDSYIGSQTHLRSANSHQLVVCAVCRGPVATPVVNSAQGPRPTCSRCREHYAQAAIVGSGLADETGFIVYACKGGSDQTYHELFQYKLQSTPLPAAWTTIAALLAQCFVYDVPRLTERAGPIDMVTNVPSTSTNHQRNARALEYAVRQALQVADAPGVFWNLITPTQGKQGNPRQLDVDRFATLAGANAVGKHILLVEDTWVSGGTVQSVAAALKRAGAARVTVLSVARLLDPSWPPSAYLSENFPSFAPPGESQPMIWSGTLPPL